MSHLRTRVKKKKVNPYFLISFKSLIDENLPSFHTG